MPKKEEEKKKRRGRNEGALRYIESKKLWEGRYVVGVDENGKSITKSIYSKKKSDVIIRMREALVALSKGVYIEPSEKSLISWCREWYEIYKDASLKTNTKEKYKTSFKRLEKAEIANIRLKDLNIELIQKYYNSLKKKGCSRATIIATHALINGALEKAEETNRITKNPARHVIIPKDEDEYGVEIEAKALTDDEQERFLYEMGRRSNYYMFALFMMNTGLRPGEAIGLNRKDIDIKKNTVKVNKTFVSALKDNQSSPKTASSKRIVPIPNDTIKLLKEYIIKQKNQEDDSPLFQTLKGTRLSPRNALRQFKSVGESIKCPWVNLHTMRHTYASKLFKEKVDIKIISKLLGHKDVSTTYDIYVHFIDNVVEDSVQILNKDIPDKLPEKTRKKKDNVVKLKKVN